MFPFPVWVLWATLQLLSFIIIFIIYSSHEFLCPLSGAVWTRLIMLAWTNNDTLMWCLQVQVTKVLLCAFQLIIISLITPPKTACTRSKCPISVMIWAWALSLHKYEYEYEYEYGYWEEDCYERSWCLFLRVWAGGWLTSYTCTNPGLMLAPKHRGVGTLLLWSD